MPCELSEVAIVKKGLSVMPTITVSYNYDIHRLIVDEPTFAKIKKGELVEVDGQGFAHEEDGLVLDHWVFKKGFVDVMFWLENGAEFHARLISIEVN